MELRVLKYFLTTAREENITKAAQSLHISQPTLSRQLMQLEEELGVTLFHRSSHNIILTDEGQLLKRRAQEMLSLADRAKNEISQRNTELAGVVTIGSGELRSVGTLSRAMSAFHAEHQQVQFSIYSGNVDNVKERIDMGLIDVGLFAEPADVSKYEFIRMPETEINGVIVRRDSDLASMKAATPKDLAEVPLLLPGRALLHNEYANWFGEYFDRLKIIANFNLLYNAAVMVRNGMGATFCDRLDFDYEDLVILPLSPKMEFGSDLAWKRESIFPPATKTFLEFAKSYIKGIS